MRFKIGDYVIYDNIYYDNYYKFIYRITEISDRKIFYKMIYASDNRKNLYFTEGSDVYKCAKIVSKEEVYVELL